MIDLTEKLTLPLHFDPKNLDIELGEGVNYTEEWEKSLSRIWKSLRLASGFTDKKGHEVSLPNLWDYRYPSAALYNGFQGIHKNWRVKDIMDKCSIRPEVTALHGGDVGPQLS